MSSITRILCPTDFSSHADIAVNYTEKLAAEIDAEIYLVHAFDSPLTFSATGQEHPCDPQIESQLAAIMRDSPRAEKIHRKQQAGQPGEVICWLAQEHNCDLIVMGTHGRSGLTHLLFGSIAEFVLRHARCPVLVIRERVENEPPCPKPSVMPVVAPRYM